MFLTGVHPADLLDEGLVKPCDYGAPNWYHEVLVEALNESVYPSNTSSLTKGKKVIKQNQLSVLFLSLKKQTANSERDFSCSEWLTAFLCVRFNRMRSPRVSSIFIFIMNKYSTHLALKISDPPKMEELAHKFVNDKKLKNLRGLWLVMLQDHYISQFFSCWFSVTIFKSLIGSSLS